MNSIQGFPFFRGATEAGESDVFMSHVYTDGTIEIKGSATSFEVEIQACIDRETEENWITLSVVDESDFSIKNTIEEAGLYSFNAMGKAIRVKINSISGGDLTAVGKFLN